MRRFPTLVLLALLGGCASKGMMTESECLMADWRAIGFEDGSRGAPASSFGAYRKACAEHGVASVFEDYLDGHAWGLETFCQPENGARLGASGYRYTGICPEELEGPFLTAHAESYGLYERGAAVDRIRGRIDSNRARSAELEYLVVDRSALLLAPHLLPAERLDIGVELKQLTEEKVALDRSIRDLEAELVDAEAEYESYRAALADRDRD